MDQIRPVAITPPTTPVVEVQQRPVIPGPAGVLSSGTSTAQPSLDPAVAVELSKGAAQTAPLFAETTRYLRDFETKAMVYRVTERASGDVVIQIPDEVVLKSRAYAQRMAAAAGEIIEKQA